MPFPPDRSFILATAGHVDHGKSALVKALTGIDPDRLPEEKARGITIDLGFAELRLPSPDGSSIRLGIVDVPGHEDFVKNMVAGVGSIDVALLVVAADDGWMPQTEEHLQILEYLGVRAAVIALAKADLVPAIDSVINSVREFLRDSVFAEAPIVPTSVVTGAGLDKLADALGSVAERLSPSRDIGKPRLPVDRAFTVRGAGTVVTGTLTGGTLREGQTVCAAPTGVVARVRSLQSHGRPLPVATPGSRVALNLPDLQPRDSRHPGRASIGRGDVVTIESLAGATLQLDAHLHRSSRKSPGNAPPLKHGSRVHLHHGSGSYAARVQLAGFSKLDAGASALARITLDRDDPLLCWVGDRFILRDWSERHTLAGGIVLDPSPVNPLKRVAASAWLTRRAASPQDPDVLVATEIQRVHFQPRDRLLLQSMLSNEQISNALDHLKEAGKTIEVGDLVVETARWRDALAAAVAAIDSHHAAHPEQAGLELSACRALLAKHLPGPAIDALFRTLESAGEFTISASAIRRSSHHPALPPRLRAAGEKIRAALAARPFDPPAKKELLHADSAAPAALKFLQINAEVVELSPDIFLSASAYTRAVALVREQIIRAGPSTVSELKTALGSSRRIVVPLLEKLDRDKITVRQGDRRTLLKPSQSRDRQGAEGEIGRD